jgi:hypothetical protein
MINIEQAGNGFITRSTYPEATPEEVKIFNDFGEMVNYLAFIYGERTIGEKIKLDIKDEYDEKI